MPMIEGRRTSTDPVQCSCGWTGELRQARHDYKPDGLDDVDFADFCPLCGTEAM